MKPKKIMLQVTDQLTGKDHQLSLSTHDAQKLYQSLGQLFGDAQYQKKPGELITMPQARIKVG
jgi:hypothetical protein